MTWVLVSLGVGLLVLHGTAFPVLAQSDRPNVQNVPAGASDQDIEANLRRQVQAIAGGAANSIRQNRARLPIVGGEQWQGGLRCYPLDEYRSVVRGVEGQLLSSVESEKLRPLRDYVKDRLQQVPKTRVVPVTVRKNPFVKQTILGVPVEDGNQVFAFFTDLAEKLTSFPKLTVDVIVSSAPTSANVIVSSVSTKDEHMTLMTTPLYRGIYSVRVSKGDDYKPFQFPLPLIDERSKTVQYRCTLAKTTTAVASECVREPNK